MLPLSEMNLRCDGEPQAATLDHEATLGLRTT